MAGLRGITWLDDAPDELTFILAVALSILITVTTLPS